MVARIRTAALAGIDGLPVSVEVDISRGLPGFHLVGLPGAEVRESRERVLSALRNAGLKLPAGKITVNLAPAGVRKSGASFDLAIALGILAAAGQLERAVGERDQAVFLGELSLCGELRPVRGLLPMVLDAAGRGDRTVVVPVGQVSEAAAVAAVQVVGVADLKQAVRWWLTGEGSAPAPKAGARPGETDPADGMARACARLARLTGQPLARKAAILAAAGRLNLLLVGPPGTGKTRLARLLRLLQPALTADEALAVTRIHSAAGTLREPGLAARRPFRAPHHTITRAGLVGGGPSLRPGEVTLAHGGLLFLDEFTEFSPAVLDVLREPLAEGAVTVARGSGCRVYPARFQLVAAMNPCRCGYLGSRERECRCTPSECARYLGRLSGPLLDRFDLFVELGTWEGSFLAEPPAGAGAAEPTGWRANPRPADLVAVAQRLAAWGRAGGAPVTRAAARFLDESRRPLGLSLRGVGRCLRVAATVAALDGAPAVERAHVQEALEFRREIAVWGAGPI